MLNREPADAAGRAVRNGAAEGCGVRRRLTLRSKVMSEPIPPAPPFTRARIVSGPFSLCVSPGKRGDVLRVAVGRSTRNRPLFASTTSLFSVWPAGRRSGWLLKFNDLRARVRGQPRVPIRHQTLRSPPAAPSTPSEADCAETTAGSYTGAAAPTGWPG